MKNTIIYLFSFLLLHLHLSNAILPPSTADKSYTTTTHPPQNGNIEFIKTSCQKTLYPDICFNSLSSYAKKINQDPSKLAIVAIGVSLSKAKKMANYVSNVSRQADYGAEPRIAAALHDCFSVFGDAVERMHDSLKQMSQITGSSSESIRFQMSNVQTWMSAAMTNEDTCTDGLSDVPNGPVKDDVISRVDKAMYVTSNALALINSFVEKVTTP
ncbi:hypothetical protein Leryth_002542 [Lithospermum erythrorhizon]|nr:hypothetical protein Leryth_002542 [Lithospermum erythrorhizon]